MLRPILMCLFSLLAMQWAWAQNYRVIGRVLQGPSKQAVPFATVRFFVGDSLKGGALCNDHGAYQCSLPQPGSYRRVIGSLGLETRSDTIKIATGMLLTDLGDVLLNLQDQTLKAYEVTAEKEAWQLQVDRRSYSVEKDLAARGGTAIDAMKSIPGIVVTGASTVELRNKSPQIFVDGRPSMLSLDMIPADDIDRIEVITNPSARFGADATGGILNVVLKKQLKPGYSGRLNAALGTGQRASVQGSINLREGKWSWNAGGGWNQSFNPLLGSSLREYGAPDSVYLILRIKNANTSYRNGQNIRMGLDYRTGLRSVLSTSYSYSENGMLSDELQDFWLHAAEGDTFQTGQRTNRQSNRWQVHSGNVVWKKTFAQADRDWSVDAGVVRSNNRNALDAQTTQEGWNAGMVSNQNSGLRSATLYTLQSDYVHPLQGKGRWETGLRLAYKFSQSDFVSQLSDSASASLSNRITIDDFIGAAYGNWIRSWGPLGVQLGMRYEHTWFVAESAKDTAQYAFIYPRSLNDWDKALFPALYLSFKFSRHREMQLNFSRKIGRPGYMQLIPFVTYADRQSVQIGNPVLAPEFISLGEANYSVLREKWNSLISLYYRNTQGAITTVVFPLPENPETLVNTYANSRMKRDAGLDVALKWKIRKNLDMNLSGQAFYTRVALDRDTIQLNNAGWSWNGRWSMNYRVSYRLQLQLSANYEAPRILPQGRQLSVYFADISANYTHNKHWQWSLTLSDMFNTKRFGTRIENAVYTQTLVRRWEQRYVRMNVTYTFGEQDVSLFRRRSQNRREPGSGGTEMQEF